MVFQHVKVSSGDEQCIGGERETDRDREMWALNSGQESGR